MSSATAIAHKVFRSLASGVRLMSSARPVSCAKINADDNQPQSLQVTLIEGQGTGPVMCAAVKKIFEAAHVPVQWDSQTLKVYREPKTNRMTVSPEVLSSAARTGLVLRAQDSTVGQSEMQSSDSLALHKALNAFVGVRKFVSVEGHQPYGPVKLVNIRDNVSGEYSEIEHLVVPGVVQSIKMVSMKSSLAVAEMAFRYATENGHSQITALHKANVMRLSDGLFLKACRDVSVCYPNLVYKEEKLDSFCLNVTSDPQLNGDQLATGEPKRYDVLLTTSLYGAFVGAVCGVLSGGMVTVPAAAYGPNVAVFSTVSDYGYSSYCRSKDNCVVPRMLDDLEPIVNPTGIIRAAAWMLDHAGMTVAGRRITAAVDKTILDGVRTRDMGGQASCAKFTDAIIANLDCLMSESGEVGGKCDECGKGDKGGDGECC
ncbi:isocitrate dehydrogenase [NAD] subunit alpha, mitochondrial-like [Aphis gossypii]|uniref:isocitrate dehydrogenase [NAD] subunit alpha, mitochondrial-like n=1 Tax=Aphis gossypii TaxID=80765 RepID=UPI0021591D0D|nr:isocitrate dehydrogenase [NAD] subunit alpha, mitochondrial-like [Aphis gossypii]